ncbi:bifunctional (p)ppGpp synthetase/guanosine-3',5'-bis(diphosphate) 3'-pyrophosphohydrolase [bacterium]|nr:bifunctional (p)ppGpp synthetase/guanosine-3',5'-bis(diphosphate) 3'-pyrophosphohydrolase [bacterium]MCB2179264.1 bifunctional (p)ppGpp synthetase/guanosine-3',5'-bis(diphosphate) 3'-pyrophosphohydrolase [bacterium]
MKIELLMESLPEYYSPADRELILRAYHTAEEAHRTQKRASGEPYINHCVAVATILSDLRVPPNVVAAGLLHDTVEDTDITLEDLATEFGEDIANLVDGVTKLTHLPRVSRSDQNVELVAQETQQEVEERERAARRGLPAPEDEESSRERSRKADLASETLRKTFLAMGEDIRVVMIKLADRLHNMRTLGYVPEAKRRRIARQTLDIFAPLASRLGIWQIKWELEDLAFRYTNPEVYKEIAENLAERRSERETQVKEIVSSLESLLQQHSIKGQVTGRPKHIYSIYKKMAQKGLAFDAIRDVRAVRILVADIPTCYSVLGLIHTKWRPLPGEFDDYIAAPKDNFYQSLHTAVIFDDGKTLEVQIRTQEMHESAEYGIAAHWRYKEGSPRDENYERRIIWLRQLMEWMQEVEDASEFVDSMKTDVFSDRVYVFTPNGDIIDLPAGATPIDFAYHVHTEVGHRCRGAKVNGRLVPLDYVLKTGDQVEILTAKRGGPSRDWLNQNLKLINTNRARSKVRHWFKRQDQDQNILSGKNLLDRELRRLSISQNDVNFGNLAREFNYNSSDELFASIGVGDLSINRVINFLTLTEKDTEEEFRQMVMAKSTENKVTYGDDSVSVLGLKGLLTTMARCCKPAPGDEIVGYITRGRGATIHRSDCPNILRIKDRERLARVSWGEPKSTYPVDIRIKAFDRDGLLRDVSTVIAEESINMKQVHIDVSDNQATFDLTLEVGNISQLSRVLTILENLPNVMDARRIKPG